MRHLLGTLMLSSCLGACNTGGEADVDRSAVPLASSSALPAQTVTTQLAVDIDRQGNMVVVSAKEIAGNVKLNTFVDSAYAYEVRSAGRVLAAQPLRELHEVRGIAAPGGAEEYFGTEEKTRVLMYVPGKHRLDTDYEIVVHELRTVPANARLDATSFSRLAAENGATVFGRLDGKRVAASVSALRAAP
jgi:hypothetical protein